MIRQVGITGGIGSGKSTVASIFSSLGFRVYYADDRAKFLINSVPDVINSIKSAFGNDIYSTDGILDRKKMASVVFNNPEKLKILNSIVHPATASDYQSWLESTPKDYPKPFIIKEAAILFESGTHQKADGIICVYAPKNMRIQRVCERDNVSEEAALERIKNQWADEKKIKMSDFVIYNDFTHMLIPQVLAAIEYFGGKERMSVLPLFFH